MIYNELNFLKLAFIHGRLDSLLTTEGIALAVNDLAHLHIKFTYDSILRLNTLKHFMLFISMVYVLYL